MAIVRKFRRLVDCVFGRSTLRWGLGRMITAGNQIYMVQDLAQIAVPKRTTSKETRRPVNMTVIVGSVD